MKKKKISTKAIIIIALILVGLAFLLVGGILAGWDIIGALTSRTALLIYFATPLVAVTIFFFVWRHKK